MNFQRVIQILVMGFATLFVIISMYGYAYYSNTHPSPPSPPKREWLQTCDREAMREVFLSCLERLPKGPDHITAAANDWSEVVKECKDAADTVACHSAYITPEEKK